MTRESFLFYYISPDIKLYDYEIIMIIIKRAMIL